MILRHTLPIDYRKRRRKIPDFNNGNSLVRYAKDRFIEIELLRIEQTGLKIPNSAITKKNFYHTGQLFYERRGF